MTMFGFRLRGRRMAVAFTIASGIAFPSAAPAQYYLPPHVPGTICATPMGWCWMPQAFPLGSPCFCPGPYNQAVRGGAS